MPNPFPVETEELLPFFELTGPGPGGAAQCTVYEGPAPTPFPATSPAPVTSIRTDQIWGVALVWETTGALNYLMAGTWELKVYLEQMGGGEFALSGNTHSMPFVSAPNTYSYVYSFSAGTVPAGAYRVVQTMTLIGPGGFRGPVGAVGDGPIIQFYDVGP